MDSSQSCPVSKLERLLLATDRSAFSEGATGEAISFAKKCSSRLYVVSVMEANPEYETIGANFFEKEEEEAIAYLKNIEKRASEEGLFCWTILRHAQEPYAPIVDEAKEKKVDMIIVGKHGRRGLSKVLMGSVAAKVIGHAPCKVLVVPKSARIEYRSILVGIDGSEHSYRAAAESVEIAKRRGSSLIVVSAIRSESEAADAKASVDRVAEMAQKEGVQVEVLTPVGRPHDVIAEIAGGRGVDLIVMGAYGKTGLRKALMGSSTEKVIGLAKCSVLVSV